MRRWRRVAGCSMLTVGIGGLIALTVARIVAVGGWSGLLLLVVSVLALGGFIALAVTWALDDR